MEDLILLWRCWAALLDGDAKSGKGRWETVMVIDPEDPQHKHLIEKRIQKEDYEGQNLWQGKHITAPPEMQVKSGTSKLTY